MPCLLKISEKKSPGLVSFNTTELFSPLFKKKKYLILNKTEKWILSNFLAAMRD